MVESNQQKWERYIQNLRRVRTLSHPKFPPETAPEFLLEAIQGNAVRCFDLMKENNALLGELVCTRDAKTLSDSDIAELEEAAGRLFNYANSEDCGVAYKIHELLLKAARFRDDVPMIVRELYYNGITLHYINGMRTTTSTCCGRASMPSFWRGPTTLPGMKSWTRRPGSTSSGAWATSGWRSRARRKRIAIGIWSCSTWR